MDVISTKIKLHPGAKEFLFEHFAILNRIFSDVLGQLEIAYISIALINSRREIFFLSSKPSIEQNLIEKGLWQYDGSYQASFIYQDQPKLWSEFCPIEQNEAFKQYKQQIHGLVAGISLPSDYDNYRVILSFGFKKINYFIQNLPETDKAKLFTIGKYCLKQISNSIVFPDKEKYYTKPRLALIR